MKSFGQTIISRFAEVLAVAIGCLLLFFTGDFLISRYVFKNIPRSLVAGQEHDEINRAFHIESDIFHHTLRANFDGFGDWGGVRYRVRTNSLGFKDARVREVAKVPDRKRLVIIGDSFTEGVGLPWDQSFVGRLSKSFPDVEILNAGVEGYSPILYYPKIKWLLDQGYTFDHLLVMIDLSDILDDLRKTREFNGVAVQPGHYEPEMAGFRSLMARRFQLTTFAIKLLRKAGWRLGIGHDLVFDSPNQAWTYDHSSAIEKNDFQPLGVAKAIAISMGWMNKLYELAVKHGIKVSVGVYPYPQTLYHDDEDSLQVKIWKDWCAGKCTYFINTFPDFFAFKRAHQDDFYERLYIVGDAHFNALGNQILADRLRKALEMGL